MISSYRSRLLASVVCCLLLGGLEVVCDREVLVVSSGADSDQHSGVLEIYDFLTRTWR